MQDNPFRRRLPPLNGLRAFEAAARHGSFSRAAGELNVTQAAVSHQIKGLEERLGLPLFRRLNRALLLTEAGQRLFPAAREAFDRIAAATAELQALDQSGALTVTALPSFAAKWLVPRLDHFHGRHPEIELRLMATERLVDFAREDVDVGIRFGSGAWPGVHAVYVADDSVTPVCAPALASRLATPADLAGMTLLHEDMRPFHVPDWPAWLAAAGVGGIGGRRGPMFSHSHILLQAAMDGQGVALAQLVLAADDLAAGRLVAPFPLRLPVGWGYYVVCLATAADRPKIKAFRDWLIAEMALARAAALGTG